MDIFKNKNFVKLFLAALMSQIGTTIGNMAFAFYLLDRFRDQPYYATIAELMYSIPTIFVFFFVGVLADRFDRKKIAENCDWIRAFITLLIFFALYLNSIPLIFLLLFLRSSITKFFFPAENSLVQGILRRDQYSTAAGLNQLLFSIFMVFGVGLGGLTYTYFGIHGAVVIDGISFIISALFIRSCHIPKEARLPNGKVTWKDLNIRSTFRDYKEGIVYILKNRFLTLILFGFFIFGLMTGSFAILPMFTMAYELSPDHVEKHAAYFSISLGIGLLIGNLLATYFANKVKTYQLFIFPIFITSLLVLILGYTSTLSVYLSIVFIIGICLAPVNVAIGGWLPKVVHPKLMGRVSGWIDPLMMFSQSLTLTLIALLFPNIIANIDYVYYGVSAILFIVFVFYFLTLPRLSMVMEKSYERKAKNRLESI
ncbi:MFS transporter [Bacillus carboniphilus]|uniref:MFS transporter n=1 Tax=Bacillus carboniphilus TaxID=86663 RepID=A0ABY9JXX9_9BACI|nr:MFS transporter [Bacillus carboniphilus]WLR43188.1 MFS transporter [Bacillus carboniphilus]